MSSNFLKVRSGVGLGSLASAPSSPVDGEMYYDSALGKFRVRQNGQWAVVSPPGLKNYIVTNPDLEQGVTTGYSLGTATLDATTKFPSGAPTFGSGASGNLSLAVVSSGQLAGTYSLSYASSAATTAGNFVATDAFSVDLEGRARPLRFQFAYQAAVNPTNGNFSGTSSNSFGVAIYDVTNSAWIMPAGVFNLVQNSGVGFATGTFQTSSNGTSYRLVMYNANASAGAITMYLDDMFVGPQLSEAGSAISDWTAFTPTGSWVTNTTYTGKWRRVGNVMEIQTLVSLTGAPTATGLTLNLPSGFTIDTSQLVTTTRPVFGAGEANFTASAPYNFQVNGNGTSGTVEVLYQSATTGAQAGVGATTPVTWVSGNSLNFKYEVPITGWSSNTVMSNDTDTRVVAMSAFKSTTQSLTSATETVITGYDAALVDTAGAFNATTGVYTVSVSGVFSVSATAIFTSNGTGVRYNAIYKNGAVYQYGNLVNPATGNGTIVTASTVMVCKAGDTISAAGYQSSGGALNIQALSGATSLNIQRISGPATVAATESVYAFYNSAAGQSIANAATSIVDFGTKVSDSHGSVTTGGSWKFTAPVSGTYQVGSNVRFANGLAWTQGSYAASAMFKNGSTFTSSDTAIQSTATLSTGPGTSISAAIVRLNAGDTIDIRASHGESAARALVASAGLVWVAINRIGN